MKKALIALIWSCSPHARASVKGHGPVTLIVALRQEPVALNPLILEGPSAYTVR